MIGIVVRAAALCATLLASAASAKEFTLESPDIAEGEKLAETFVFKGFGCDGANTSPALTWSGAPEGTKSFVITAYDPDAPTGSGWWHWTVLNLPADTTSVARGASPQGTLPKGAMELRNDYGAVGFGGACPPPGEVHRYVFTVYALEVAELDLPAYVSNALAGFMTRSNALASASITAVYAR